jgi:hypothetical protein
MLEILVDPGIHWNANELVRNDETVLTVIKINRIRDSVSDLYSN